MTGVITLVTLVAKNKLAGQNSLAHFEQINNRIAATFDSVPNTNIFILYFKNPALIDKADYRFGVKNNGVEVRSQIFSARNTGDPADLRIQFESITDSDTLTVFVEPTSPGGILQVGTNANGSLAFTAYYRQQWSAKLVTQVFKKIAADPIFLLLWGGTILLCAVIL